jgi:hypothetical protein
MTDKRESDVGRHGSALPVAGGGLVVVGFAEALAAPEAVWSLVDAGFRVVAFSRRGRRSVLRVSRHVRVVEVTPPEQDAAAAQAEVREALELCNREVTGPRVVLPLDDASLCLCRPSILPPGWKLAGAPEAAVDFALDKARQVVAARNAGLAVLESMVATTRAELLQWKDRLPVIIRPAEAQTVRDGRYQKGANFVCATPAEFDRVVGAWDERSRLLVQPFISGIGEGVFGLATETGVVAWSGHRRIRMMNPAGSGSSACVASGVDPALQEKISSMVAAAGWRGIFMVELLRDSAGTPWFVEFNGRCWGSLALARRLGMEYPCWAVMQAIDPNFVPKAGRTTDLSQVICRNLGREIMHLLFVLRGPKSSAFREWPSVGATIRELLFPGRKTRYYNWRRDDWRVFFADCWSTLRANLLKS